MPNKSHYPHLKFIYKNAANKERAVIRELRKQGYDLAQRSAGSRSPVDVWAVNSKEKKIKLVQVKTNISKRDEEKLLLENGNFNGNFEVIFEVWD